MVSYRIFPHRILARPTEICITAVRPGKRGYIQFLDDERIVINRNSNMVLNLFFPLVSLFLGSMIISSLCDHHDIGEKIFYSITGFPLLIAGLFYVIYFICQPRKDLVFNRMEQTVTLPGLLWMKPVIAGFDEIIVKATERQPSRANPVPGLLLGKPGTFLRHAELIGNPESDWSFYVWYMDRNRPLPPGSAFDEFRDRDKTRRRRDGSPPPLYGSDI